jgi:hypothetical protein
VDGEGQADGSWGMSTSKMGKKHPKDVKTTQIEAQNALISVNTNQTLKIIIKINCDDSKS